MGPYDPAMPRCRLVPACRADGPRRRPVHVIPVRSVHLVQQGGRWSARPGVAARAPATSQALVSRALRIFRDDTGLAVTETLWPAITDALDQSAFLILLLSPRAAESEWVNREVEHWRTHCPGRPVLLVLAEGECHWDSDRADFEPASSTAVPKALFGSFSEEPRWVDMRWARGESQLDLRHSRFRDAVAQLAAPLHGRPKDDLESADVRLHRGTVRLVWIVVAALLVLALVALVGWNDSVRQRRVAEDQTELATARSLIAGAEVRRRGDVRRALQLGVAADRIRSTAESRAGLYASLTSMSLATTLVGPTNLVTDSIDLGGFSPDGRSLLVAGSDIAAIWDVSNPSQPARTHEFGGHLDAVSAVTFAPDGRSVVTGSADRTIGIWLMDALAQPVREATIVAQTDSVLALAISSDGRTMATGGPDGAVGLWDLADSARPVRTAVVPVASAVRSLLLLPDSRALLVATGDGQVLVYDIADRSRPVPMGVDKRRWRGGVFAVAVSPDGRTLAVGAANGRASLWDIADLSRPVRTSTLSGHLDHVVGVGFAPDGRTMATASEDGVLRIWDITDHSSPTTLSMLDGISPVGEVAFSPDNRTLAAGVGDDAVALWDLTSPATPARVATLSGHAGAVYSLAFSTDGRILATGGIDRTAALWDVAEPARPARAAVLSGFDDAVTTVRLAPVGNTLITGGWDGSAALWNIDGTVRLMADLTGWACAAAGGGLTPEAWQGVAQGVEYRSTC